MRSFIAFKREFFYDNFLLLFARSLDGCCSWLSLVRRFERRRELLNVVYLSKSNESDWRFFCAARRRKSLDDYFVLRFNFDFFWASWNIRRNTKKLFLCSSISSTKGYPTIPSRIRFQEMKNCYLQNENSKRRQQHHHVVDPLKRTKCILFGDQKVKMLCVGEAEKCKKDPCRMTDFFTWDPIIRNLRKSLGQQTARTREIVSWWLFRTEILFTEKCVASFALKLRKEETNTKCWTSWKTRLSLSLTWPLVSSLSADVSLLYKYNIF